VQLDKDQWKKKEKEKKFKLCGSSLATPLFENDEIYDNLQGINSNEKD